MASHSDDGRWNDEDVSPIGRREEPRRTPEHSPIHASNRPRSPHDDDRKYGSSSGHRERSPSPRRARSPDRGGDNDRSGRRDYSPRRSGYRDSRSSYRPRFDKKGNPCPVLAIFGLGTDVTKRDLEEHLSKEAPVQELNLILDKRTNLPKGFAFATFNSTEDATRVRDAYNETDFNGKEMRIDFSSTGKPHESTPGKYMGRRDPPRRDHRSHPYGGHDSYRHSDRHSGYDRDRDRDYRRDRDYGRDSYRDDRRDSYRDSRDDRRDSYRDAPPRDAPPRDAPPRDYRDNREPYYRDDHPPRDNYRDSREPYPRNDYRD